MSDIVEIKHLAAQGLKAAQIARRTGMHPATIAKYVDLSEIPPKLERKRVARKIDGFVSHIEARLAQFPELTAERLFREIQKLGYKGSRRSVRRFVASACPKPLRVYKPVETLPGQQAQADWAYLGTFEHAGQVLKLYAFVLVLSYSRARYVEFTFSQDTATFLACHTRAFVYLGGVPHEILYDNAKTVVQERVGHVVRFHADLLRFAALHRFGPRACWMQDPESKGKVENSVQYVRRDFYYGSAFSTAEDLRQQGRQWMDEVANRKVCEATGRVPLEVLEEERSFLLPLPEKLIELPTEIEARISKTCLLHWGGNQYSVPHVLARRKVMVQVYENRLDVLWEGKKVVTLPRLWGKGQRHVQDAHYEGRPKGPGARGETLQQRFEAIGPAAVGYLRGLARDRQGHLREQVEKILALGPVYGLAAVHGAMERATNFGAYSYRSLKGILETQERAPGALPEPPAEGLPVTVDLPAVEVQQRSPSYYQHARGLTS